MNKLLTLSAAAIACGAAASEITVDSVTQRWPWNNKLDITYTVSGGQTLSGSGGIYARIEFTANIGGTEYTIDGVHDVGASANDGTHTVTWELPDGLKAANCTMTAKLYGADAPSGDDYMVVDLDTGAISFEGMLASQEASNARYNNDLYKSTNSAGRCCMVLRKVPRWAERGSLENAATLPEDGYPVGHNGTQYSENRRSYWKTEKGYYIGVFPVTQYQYKKIRGSNPSYCTTANSKPSGEGNKEENRPVERVSWNDLRRPSGVTDNYFASTSSIPAVAEANTGTFFQRLNYKTGLSFDLPTEVMSEIAERAGATTIYFWGDTMTNDFVACTENCGNAAYSGNCTVAVGERLPNGWGLYDTAGNVFEWCRDDNSLANLGDIADPFVPAWSGNKDRRSVRGGGAFNQSSTSYADRFRASFRYNVGANDNTLTITGFRVAMVVE